MSLRNQIHSAIDEVAPPDPSLPREIVKLIHSHAERRPRRAFGSNHRWSVGMRRAASLIAATLIIVLMVGLVLTGRIWRDQSIFGTTPHTVDHATVSKLVARPLMLPVVKPGGTCPEGPHVNNVEDPLGWGYGSGPVFAEGSGTRYGTANGTYFDTHYGVSDTVSLPVLIRARDLESNQTVVFGKSPYEAYPGTTPVGAFAGVDTVIGRPVQLYTQVLLEYDKGGYLANAGWEVIQGFPNGSSGCIGFQADGIYYDGTGFSEIFVISYSV